MGRCRVWAGQSIFPFFWTRLVVHARAPPSSSPLKPQAPESTRKAARCSGSGPWSHAGGGDLLLQRTGLRVDGGEVFAGPAHAGVLGADEAGVGCYGLAHPLDGAA